MDFGGEFVTLLEWPPAPSHEPALLNSKTQNLRRTEWDWGGGRTGNKRRSGRCEEGKRKERMWKGKKMGVALMAKPITEAGKAGTTLQWLLGCWDSNRNKRKGWLLIRTDIQRVFKMKLTSTLPFKIGGETLHSLLVFKARTSWLFASSLVVHLLSSMLPYL